MGCILGIIAFIWKVLKFVFNSVIRAVGVIVNIFIDLGLTLPFLGAVTLLVLWLINVITPGSSLFTICWIGLLAFTVFIIFVNIKRFKRRRRKAKEKAEALKRFEQEQRDAQKEERRKTRDERRRERDEKR